MKWSTKNIRMGFIAVLLCLAAEALYAQESAIGIYMTVKNSRKCKNPVLSADKKKYCLVEQPVLTKADLSSISSIKLDLANQPYFSVAFTEDGAKKLKNLSIAFPNSQIVLVVDKVIIGFLKDLESFRSNLLKMTAENGSEQSLETIHDKLKLFVPVRN